MSGKIAAVAALILAVGAFGPSRVCAEDQPAGTATSSGGVSGVQAGFLTCHEASGWGFVFGSSRDLTCIYEPKTGLKYHYVGTINKFGVDIGYQAAAVLVWAVVAPTTNFGAGSLAGHYGGVNATVTAGLGAEANILVGGMKKSFALQPISVGGTNGLNVAAGIASLTLKEAPKDKNLP